MVTWANCGRDCGIARFLCEVVKTEAAVHGQGLAVSYPQVADGEALQRLVQDLELEGNSFLVRPQCEAVADLFVRGLQTRWGWERWRGDREADVRDAVHAVGEGADERRELHAVGGTEIEDVDVVGSFE